MRLIPLKTRQDVGYWAAVHIINKINNHKNQNKLFVLGLPTGSTPLITYKYLIKAYQQKLVSFKDVITFNMDEYLGLAKTDHRSYFYFMFENLFKYIDINIENTNILDGMAQDIEAECQRYENKIKQYGGIDLFLGGVGEDGHIAFNEPGSSLSSRVRDKLLTPKTRQDNARFFDDISQVPRSALTVGIANILEAKEVVILATGNNKALAVKEAVEGSVNHLWTITALQMHPRALLITDDEAISNLQVKNYRYFCELRDLEPQPKSTLEF